MEGRIDYGAPMDQLEREIETMRSRIDDFDDFEVEIAGLWRQKWRLMRTNGDLWGLNMRINTSLDVGNALVMSSSFNY